MNVMDDAANTTSSAGTLPIETAACDAKPLRTPMERQVGEQVERIFLRCPDPIEIKLENFPKYVRRQQLKRFLAMYEVFKLAMPVKGSVVECGVFRGFGLMSWAKISTILEPENLTRRIYGFDTFQGFPSLTEHDRSELTTAQAGDLAVDSYNELQALLKEYDRDRFLGHIPKVELIRGDITRTIPKFVESNPHLIVSLLFIDCDIFEPTKAALIHLVPRMPKGAILAFDDLDNPLWPGETLAVLETIGLKRIRLRRLEWDPYIAFAELE
jgi:macrocin-O-methyltransferase TylF-like protien